MKLKIVHGAPCSGKSTYVKEHINSETDIVYDYDRLTRALNYKEKHCIERDSTHQFVVDFRLAIVKRLKADGKERKGTCWFIGTYINDGFKEFVKDLNPQYIEIEATEEECLERLSKDDSREEKEKWAERIKEYFKKKEGENMTDKQLNKLNNGREYRTMQLEVRSAENEEMIVEGYATTFNQPYLLFEGRDYKVFEQVAPTAFDSCDMTDVIFQYDHEGRVFARTRNKTLELMVDEKGLKVRANLGGTDEGKKLYHEIKEGYIDRMSFGFVVQEDEKRNVQDLENGTETITRTITKISKLYDVSAVSIPANDMTTISARNFGNGLIEEVKADRLKKAQLKLKIKMMEV